MSPDDICTTCNHPRHCHKNGAGICMVEESLLMGLDPCHCNLFREAPPLAVNTEPDVVVTVESVSRAWPHLPLEFLDAMNAVFEAGLKGDRVAMDWKDLPSLVAANKTANLFIHMDAKEYAEVACNALILWWHFQRTQTAVTITPGNNEENDHENT